MNNEEAVRALREMGVDDGDEPDLICYTDHYQEGFRRAVELISEARTKEPDKRAETLAESVVYAKDIADWWSASGWRARVLRIDSLAADATVQAGDARDLAAEAVARLVETERRIDERLASLAERVNAIEEPLPPHCVTPDGVAMNFRVPAPEDLTEEQLDKIAAHLAEPDETRRFQVMVDAVYDITCPEEVGVDEWHEVPAALKVAVRKTLPDELLHDVFGTPIDEVEPVGVHVLEVVPDSEVEPPPTEPVELPFEVLIEDREAGRQVVTIQWPEGCHCVPDDVASRSLSHHQATYAGIRLMTAAAKVRRALAEKGGES